MSELNHAIVSFVEKTITGRMANKLRSTRTNDVEILLDFVEEAGGGNHLEIGTLFGGSAISVAIMKEILFHSGIVLCIDPLDGYYPQYAKREDKKDSCGELVVPEVLFKNIFNFGVSHRIAVMQTYSTDIIELPFEFSTAYIDGDHTHGVPELDWNLVKDKVSHFVIFDNYDDLHPDVSKACEVANNDPDWICVYKDNMVYVVERINDENNCTCQN